MRARQKLNSVFLIITLITAVLAGVVTQSAVMGLIIGACAFGIFHNDRSIRMR